MSKITLQQAADMVGITKQAIRKATKSGKLSFEKDAHGRLLVQAGDVERIWETKINPPISADGLESEVTALRERLANVEHLHERERNLLNQQIEDLRTDKEAWRGQAERLLLEHQPSEKPKGLFARIFNL